MGPAYASTVVVIVFISAVAVHLIATLVATDLEVDLVAAIAVAAKCKLPECAAVNLSFDFAE